MFAAVELLEELLLPSVHSWSLWVVWPSVSAGAGSPTLTAERKLTEVDTYPPWLVFNTGFDRPDPAPALCLPCGLEC
jgi:hypothetical protein